MSFANRVKHRLCQIPLSPDEGIAFGCGLLFSHAGRERPFLIRTDTADAVTLLDGIFEQQTGRPLPVVLTSSAADSRSYTLSIARRGASPIRRAAPRCRTSVGFAEPVEDSRRAVFSVFGKWDGNGGPLSLDDIVCASPEIAAVFLRGLFIANGVLSEPTADYHFEICGLSAPQAREVARVFIDCGFTPLFSQRGERRTVYFKDGEQIEYLLAFLGDTADMFELSSLRVERDVRNRLNRQINCDAANLVKAKGAADRQTADIRLIYAQGKEDGLSEELRATAEARLANEDASLAELGRLLGVGRSGVNHRLRRLSALADELRGLHPGED